MNSHNKQIWFGTLLCSLMLSNITTIAAASEITTPIILNTNTTYTSADNVNITSLGANSSAISTTHKDSKLNLSGQVDINLSGLNSSTNILYFTQGITNLTGSQLNIKAQSNANITGIFLDAYILSNAQLNNSATTNIELTGQGQITGVRYDNPSATTSTLSTTNITLNTLDANATVMGLYMNKGLLTGDLNVNINGGKSITGASGDLTTHGNSTVNINSANIRLATALHTTASTIKSSSTTNLNIVDTGTTGLAVNGLHIRGSNTASTTVESGATLNINVQSQAIGDSVIQKALSGANGIVLFTSNNALGSKTAAGSTINITMNGQAVNNLGQNGTAGITAAGTLQANGSLNIDIQSVGGAGIRLTDSPLDVIPTIGQVELNGDTIIKTNQGYALLSATYGIIQDIPNNMSTVTINKNGSRLVQLTGNLEHKTQRYSHFDINLDRADSFLTGSSMSSNTLTYPWPQIKECLSLTDIRLANGATWNMTGKDSLNTSGNSVVNSLTFASHGLLNMTYSDSALAYSYEKLTAHGWLGDNGNILMNTDLQASFDTKDVAVDSDRIIINKYIDPNNKISSPLSQGTHTIDIKDTSLLSKVPAEGYLLLISDQTQGAAKFVGGNLIKGGIFKYKPIITDEDPQNYTNIPTDANNWYLAGFKKTGVTDEAVVNAGLAESRYIAYMNEQDTLVKRLGELRQHDKADGLWVRIRGSNNSVDGYGLSRNSYVSTHLGYDKRLKDEGTTKRYLGLAFNHTNNNFDFAASSASGKGQSNVLTIYGTRLGDKGHYLDLVGKLGRMPNDYKYQNQYAQAKSWFYSLSAEYGRSIARDKGWYYEPQVQFTYGHINSASYGSQEMQVNADSINSAILRAGILFGRKFNQEQPEKNGSYYAKLFYNHEFGGAVKARMTDVYGDRLDFKHSYSGSWLTVGLGTSLNLNKKTNLYLDVEKAFGGKVSGGWAWQGGVRWRF